MPRMYQTGTNFQAGELAPAALMRSDSAIYRQGASKAKNARLLLQGGVAARCGTRYLATLTPSVVRLESWPVSDTRAFICIFSVGAVSFRNAATGITVTLTGQPWASVAVLDEMTVVSAGTQMIVCHPSFPPRDLSYDPVTTSFTSAVHAFAVGYGGTAPFLQPYHQFTRRTWMSVSAYPDRDVSVTVTVGQPMFSALHVGTIWKWAGVELEITAVTNVFTATAKGREASPRAIYYRVKDSTGFRQGETVRISSGEGEGTVVGAGQRDSSNALAPWVSVMPTNSGEWAIDSTTPKYLIGQDVSTQLVSALAQPVAAPVFSNDWAEPAYSDVRGWPGCACYHQGRLVFGGSTQLPNWLFFSVIGDFYSFDEGYGEDDSAFKAQVAVDRIITVRHLVSAQHLQIFAGNAEFYIPQSDSTPLTPTTCIIRPQTRYGCARPRPVMFDGLTHYAASGGRTVRQYGYVDADAAYASPSISAPSAHLIRDPVDLDVQLSGGQWEEQYLYVVNADGTLAVYHGLRQAGIAGWAPWTTDGLFKSVCAIGSEVWFAVQRSANGSTQMFLEKLDPTVTVDCAETATASASGTGDQGFSPSAVNVGAVVDVMAGTAFYGRRTLASAGFQAIGPDIPATGTVLTIGRPIDFQLATLPIVNINGYQVGGKIKRVVRVEASILESVTVTVAGSELSVFSAGDDFAQAPPLRTGLYRFGLTGYSKEGIVTLTRAVSLPLTVLGLHLEVSA